jgi:hypothetical protein
MMTMVRSSRNEKGETLVVSFFIHSNNFFDGLKLFFGLRFYLWESIFIQDSRSCLFVINYFWDELDNQGYLLDFSRARRDGVCNILGLLIS